MRYTLLSLLALLLLFSNCKTADIGEQVTAPSPSLDSLWDQFEEYKKLERPESAMAVLDSIMQIADQQNMSPHYVKAAYLTYVSTIEKQGETKGIEYLQDLLEKNSGVRANLLHYLTGLAYYEYYDHNQWEINSRTAIIAKPDDVKTWGHKQFLEEIQYHLFESVDTALRKENLHDWKLVVQELDSSLAEYRPTLYDVVVPDVINMLSSSNMQLLVLDEAKWLKDERLFEDKEEFYKIDLKDSLSSLDESIVLFQDWLQWRESQSQDNLAHADLSRLGYFHMHSKHPNRDKLFIHALNRLIEEYEDTMAIARAMHQKASLYHQMGKALVENNINGYQKAVAISEELIRKFSQTRYAKDAKTIIESIQSPHLGVQLEQVNLSGKPFLVYLHVKNLSSVSLEAYPVTPKQLETIRKTGYKEFPEIIQKLERATSHSYELPVVENYTYKNFEVAFPSLPDGLYVIVAKAGDGVFWQSIEVTDLATFTIGGHQLMVVDRNSGLPIDSAKVTMIERDWKSPSVDTFIVFTDKEGKFILEEDKKSYTVSRVQKGERNHYPDIRIYSSRDRQDRWRRQIHMLTDRSLYRPGQTVYFKGVLYRQIEDSEWKVISNESLNVTLIDQNGQVIEKMELSTNAWGSIDGTFRLPLEMLTGNVQIRTPFGSISVKVEEYKRPGFKVDIEVKKGAKKAIGDTLQIDGVAETFNGIGLDNAKVQFTVRRQYYIPWYYSYYPPVNEGQKEIASGTLRTNKNGQFSVEFQAHADSSNIYARYEVLVEVTDRGGETQTSEMSISLSGKPYQVQGELSKILVKEQADKLAFEVINNFEQPVKAQLSASLVAIDGPEPNKVRRYWNFPDSILMPEVMFRQQFEHYAYKNKDRPEEWEPLYEVGKTTINADSSFTLPQEFWQKAEKGWYRLTFTNSSGELINTYYFEMINGESRISSQPQLTFFKLPSTLEPGQSEIIKFVKPFQESEVYRWIAYPQRQDEKAWTNKSQFRIAPKESDRGGITVSMVSVMHNRIYSQNDWINVPWTNMDLDIRTRTFRDVLKPGTEEQWTFTISDPDAALAATLYDASLDKIHTHQWSRINYPEYRKYIGVSYNSFQSIGMRTSVGIDKRYQLIRLPEYPTLKFNEIDFRYNRVILSDMQTAAFDERLVVERGNFPSDEQQDAQIMQKSRTSKDVIQKEDNIEDIRENLDETVLFEPIVRKDGSGVYHLDFTMGEALTAWNLFLFAHTKEMKTGIKSLKVVTRKELMIKPLLPRFFRSGDTIQVIGRVQNQSGEELSAETELLLKNALTGEVVTDQFAVKRTKNILRISKGQSSIAGWTLIIPEAQDIPAVEVQMWARSEKWTDGESNVIPLVSDRIIVQEALPLEVSSQSTNEFDLKSWSQKYLSKSTAQPLEYRLEFTKRPLWYAVQALPYLSGVDFECSERLVNQLYANALAEKIASEIPNLENILRQWEKEGNLKSPLMKNEKWKSVDLDQTPWLRNALNATSQMQKIDLLLNDQKRNYQSQQIIEKLRGWQNADGGFSWFRGGPSNPYMSQYIAIQMQRMVDLELTGSETVIYILNKLTPYCDREFEMWYERIAERTNTEEKQAQWGLTQVHYYYLKSNQGIIPDNEAWRYLDSSLNKHWTHAGLYEQALIARSWQLQNNAESADPLILSFREKALKDQLIGAYWNQSGLRRTYTDDIELHALMIEVFEAAGQQDFTQQLKTWLIKNKQTNHWSNSKSTAAAIHALLLEGQSGLDDKGKVEITSGGTPIDWTSSSAIEGFHTSLEKEATPGSEFPISFLKVDNSRTHPVWGAAYIQYSDEMDAIIPAEGDGLKIEKRYFVEQWGVRGAELMPLEDAGQLRVGDVLVARIIVSVDRSMDFVHLKSERPSSMEPVSQLSGFKYRDGIGHYESIKDLATHFFIDHLPKGTFVFEHRERVVLEGNCLGGLSQVESMYAPEFRAHTSGRNLETVEK